METFQNRQPITTVIRDAIIYNHERENQYTEIQEILCVSRSKAKQLFFCFLYKADELTLTRKLLEEPVVIN